MADRSVVVKLRADIAQYEKAMKDAGLSTKGIGDNAAKASKEANTAFGKMAQAAKDNRDSWDKAGTALLGFGTLTVAGLGMAAKAAVDWESQWAGVLKTVNGTDAELSTLEVGLRDLAKTLPSTHGEIAAVAEAAGQLGVQTGAVVGFTKVMIDLGETTNLSADEAATSIAQLMNVMGTAPDDVGRLGASLVALGNAGASTERDIIQMAQRLSGAGKLVGASEDEVLALANAMASMGIEAELGGGAMSRTMVNIFDAVKSGGDELAAFAEVAGMTATDFAAAFEADPIRAVDAFTQGLDRIDQSGGNVVESLKGLGIEGTQDLQVLLRLKGAGDLLSESLDLGARSWAENTALIEEAGKRYDTTEAKMQIAKNGIADTAIVIGETLLPMLASAAGHVSSLAEFVGGLPKPLLDAATGLGAVGGAAGLAGGAFLLVFPRVMDTVDAFRNLKDLNPKVASGLGKVGKAAGLVGIAMAAAATMTALFGNAKGASSVEVTTKALLGMAGGVEALDVSFQSIQGGSESFDGIADAMDRLINPTVYNRMNDFAMELLTLGSAEGAPAREELIEQFGAIGNSLASLVEGGNIDLARERFETIRAEWEAGGGSIEDLRDLMPGYVDALAGASNEQALAGESAAGLADGVAPVAPAVEEATDALKEWTEMVSGADASFINLNGAWDSVIQKNTDVATSTAESTESAEDSWEDYYDGVSVSTDAYLKELEGQMKAQQDWEKNVILLSGRASQAVVDAFIEMGVEGAPILAEFVNASDQEMARLETVYGQRTAEATTAVATNIRDAGPIIAAAGAQLGKKAADEIADKLAKGEITVQQAIDNYDLKDVVVPVSVDTDPAQVELDAWIARNNKIHPGVRIAKGPGGSGGTTSYAEGGFTGVGGKYEPAGVVHKGEFVSDAATTSRHRALLEALPGYAGGGYVNGITLPVNLDTSTLTMPDGAGGGTGANGGTASSLVAFGRMLQAMGFSVGEHPAFGGVHGGHMVGSKHYRAAAIDVNHGAGTSASEQRFIDGIMPLSRSMGLGSIWRAPGHFNHAHFEYDQGGMLPPGYTSVYNGTGKPEAVFTENQLAALTAGNGGGASQFRDLILNEVTDMTATATAVTRRLAMRRA